ncbi:MAG: hypothetical protein Q8N83_00025 [Ignavibacteria bacterium]|nr:hypothetical protein [Ignavibacteria bacterium]
MLIIFLFLINGYSFCQIICEDNLCTNKIETNDIFQKVQSDANILKKESKLKRQKLKSEGKRFDLNCDYPSFWIWDSKNGKQIKKIISAEAIGTSIRIYREMSCDVNKSMLAVPIKFNGEEHWAVTNFEGESVFLDNAFINLITHEDYWCDGLPLEPTMYHVCNICKERYASQLFEAKIGDKDTLVTYYSGNAMGQCIDGKNHDNRNLKITKGCPKSEGNDYIRR